MERYRYRETCKDVELSLLNANTLQPIYKQYGQCTANQPGWQKEDEIMNLTYKRHVEELVPVSEIRLLAAYRTTLKQNITIDYDNMQKIYDLAYHYVSDWSTHPNYNQHISKILNEMSKYNITEDMMTNFAYQKIKCEKSHYVPLLFSCLKRYNIDKQVSTITTTKTTTNLTEALGIELMVTQDTGPVYQELINKLEILKDMFIGEVTPLNCILYSDMYKNTKPFNLNEFYQHAYRLIYDGNHLDLFNAVQMLEKQNLLNLGQQILKYDIITFKDMYLYFFNTNYNTLNTKNRIALFVHLVDKYNSLRGSLITPLCQQYFARLNYIKLNLAVPDTFNKKLFDDEVYAFSAFTTLKKNVITLIKSEDFGVQEAVDYIYL